MIQTDWQARTKPGELGRDAPARRALATHVATYTLAFIPALVWAGEHARAAAAVLAGVAVALSHAAIDDGRLVAYHLTRVKRCRPPVPLHVALMVDQTIHLITLWAVAVVVAG